MAGCLFKYGFLTADRYSRLIHPGVAILKVTRESFHHHHEAIAKIKGTYEQSKTNAAAYQPVFNGCYALFALYPCHEMFHMIAPLPKLIYLVYS